MSTPILGLPSSAKFAALQDRFFSHRRNILTSYPNGAAKLTGILSALNSEPVGDSIHYWYEEHYKSPELTLRGTNPCTTNAPSTGDANDGTAITSGAKNITTDFFLKVTTTADVKVGDVFFFATSNAQAWVTAVVPGVANEASLGYVRFRFLRAHTVGTVATEFAADTKCYIIGSAYGEGQAGRGLQARAMRRPYTILNTTQIFRDRASFPGSVLKMGLKYDDTGPYKKRMKDLVVDHMTSIERALIWGRRSTTLRASFDSDQENLSVRTMSGILEFLELWDAGSAGLSIDGSTYAPYSFKAPSVSDTDDQKRIIENADGLVTVRRFNEWSERVGRYNSNKTNEKLVLLGSGALMALADMFRLNTSFNVTEKNKIYGLSVITIVTPFGDWHLVTHPLFNENPIYRHWMLMLDIHQLIHRPLGDRDTKLLKNRQNNGDDFRTDEFLTEITLELHNPHHHMLVKNVRNYSE